MNKLFALATIAAAGGITACGSEGNDLDKVAGNGKTPAEDGKRE